MKIILILISLLLPNIVLAKISVPDVYPYEAIINNTSGSICYSMDYNTDTLLAGNNMPYGTKVSPNQELTINKVDYVYGKAGDYTCYIKLNDIKVTSSDISMEEYQDKEINEEYTILHSLEIHSSPAKAYDVVGSISKGLNVTVLYNYNSWYYIKTGISGGWIDSYGGGLGKLQENEIRVFADSKLRDFQGNVLTTVPTKAVITKYYELADEWSRMFNGVFVTYNGIGGYLVDDIGIETDLKIQTLSSIQGFSTYDSLYNYKYKGSTTYDIQIPEYTTIKANYYSTYKNDNEEGTIYVVSYQNKEYFIQGYINDYNTLNKMYVKEITDTTTNQKQEKKEQTTLDNKSLIEQIKEKLSIIDKRIYIIGGIIIVLVIIILLCRKKKE